MRVLSIGKFRSARSERPASARPAGLGAPSVPERVRVMHHGDSTRVEALRARRTLRGNGVAAALHGLAADSPASISSGSLARLAAERPTVRRLPGKMSFWTRRASGLAASVTLAIGVGSAVGLL